MREAKNHSGKPDRKTIAVDFDGTLCEDAYPGIGEPNEDIVSAAIKAKDEGAALILWTCRTGKRLAEAVAWCGERGLAFDAVNENLPEQIARYGADSRKVYADEYWDDRARRPEDCGGAAETVKFPVIRVFDKASGKTRVVGASGDDELYVSFDGQLCYLNRRDGCGTRNEYAFVGQAAGGGWLPPTVEMADLKELAAIARGEAAAARAREEDGNGIF